MQNEKNDKEITLKLSKSVAKNFLKASIISSCWPLSLTPKVALRLTEPANKIFHNFFVFKHFYKIQKDRSFFLHVLQDKPIRDVKKRKVNFAFSMLQFLKLQATFLYSIYHQRAGKTNLFHMKGVRFHAGNTLCTINQVYLVLTSMVVLVKKCREVPLFSF